MRSRRSQRAASRAVVGDQHQGGAGLTAQVEQQVDDLVAGGLVQVAGGFIGEEYLGPGGIGAGDGHALLFTTRELPGVMAGAGGQSNALQGLVGAAGGVRRPGQLQGQQDVFARGEGRQELEVLEDEANPAAAQGGAAILVQGIQGLTTEPDGTGGGIVKTGQEPQQGGLTGARSAEDGDGFPGLDVQVEPFQDGQDAGWACNMFGQSHRSGNGHRRGC
jgi:hypothetical protein